MKKVYVLMLICFASLQVFSQAKNNDVSKPNPSKKIQIVEASCGECKFNLEGDGCDLAVRIKGKAYFVDGTHINDHGDAHAKQGFCNSIRKAEVQGELIDERFKVTYFKLIDTPDGKGAKP
mgnify:FL=1